MIRIGIIGCGKMGKIYANNFSKNPHCIIKGFYNRTRERATELSKLYPPSSVYDSWEEMLDSNDIDAVGICTPSNMHKAQFISALAHGKHVLCEKPMANNMNECFEMLDVAKKTTATSMIGFQMRYHPVVTEVSKQLEMLGDIYYIDMSLSMYRPEVTWKHKLNQGGGVMKELACHLIDLARMWCGEILNVQGVNIIFNSRREVEDFSQSFFQFENGGVGLVRSDYLDRNPSLIKAKTICEKGQIEWQFSSYKPEDAKIELINNESRHMIRFNKPIIIDKIYPGHFNSFSVEINHFIEMIMNGEQDLSSILRGVKALEAINASYLSTALRQSVDLPLQGFNTDILVDCFKHYHLNK